MHNFKKGDWVYIINSAGGQFFLEGKAEVVKRLSGREDYYLLRMKMRDRVERLERYVDPNAQEDPFEYVARLNARARGEKV